YTYLPSMALAVMLGGGFALLWRRMRIPSLAAGAAALYALSTVTWIQTTYWRDSMTMWQRVVQVSPESGMGYDGVGTAYFQSGDSQAAYTWYQRALALDPENAGSHMNMGMALVGLKRYDEAIKHLERAADLKPGNSDAETNWGVALSMQGNIVSAVGHY